MQELKKQILSRVSLPSLIGQSVNLQKRSNFSVGCCPFHEENTPSFYVYDDHYHCFGCGEHGDAINFVRKVQGLSFMDSLRYLAEKAGVSLDSLEEDKKYASEWKKKARENQLLQAAKDFFVSQFKDPFQGKFAREYLDKRQISQTLVEELGIGYAPAFPDALWNHLKKLGFRAEELSTSSLINQGRGGRIYDFFQNRLIVPIRDEQSRVIAFTGRSLGDEVPKYKNSRFEKGSFLFGLDHARNAIRQKSRALIVEGHFDALQMWNHGFHETVACQGTALTHEHLRKLNALTHQVILVFDGDEAGRKAALKVLDGAFEFPEIHFKIALLPLDEDPDSLLKSKGVPALEHILEKCEDLLDFAISEKLRNAPQTGVSELISKSIVPWLEQIQDPIRRAVFIQKISQQTGISPKLLTPPAKTLIKSRSPIPVKQASRFVPDDAPIQALEKEFVGHLYYAQAHQTPLNEVEELVVEYMELPGIWNTFVGELLSCLQNGENPESKTLDFWQSAQDPAVHSFLEEIAKRKSAFSSSREMGPFAHLRLESRKKTLRKTLESLKQKSISLKMQRVEDQELWGHLTHSLLRTTQELETLEKLVRQRS